MKITMDYLFNTLNKHRITGSVDPKNSDSIKLLERLNFRKEAHFKESLFINGEWVDDIVYGILKSEWNPNYNTV
jgi:RimJ/RimL family protein N-acetyltransferase